MRLAKFMRYAASRYANPGEIVYTIPGTYAWTAPQGVTSVCVVCVGGGGQGGVNAGGGGGGLGWKNNIPVTPGQNYTVVVGGVVSNNMQPSYFIDLSTVAGYGGDRWKSTAGWYLRPVGGGYVGDGGGNGGSGGVCIVKVGSGYQVYGGLGGGAGGYLGNGGDAAYADFVASHADVVPATSGSGGGGGGGGCGLAYYGTRYQGSGGGVGLYGVGSSGAAGVTSEQVGLDHHGRGGSNGTGGSISSTVINGSYAATIAPGGLYGGGGGGGSSTQSPGGGGAVRIIWGQGRSFPYNAGPTS